MIKSSYVYCLLFGLLSVSDGFTQVTGFRTVLFVGNSLTSTNNLPRLVKEIAVKHGLSLETEMLTFPDFALADHWQEGKLQKLITSGKFDVVVVQQGPSSQADGRAMLLDYGHRLKKLCEKNNAALAFFMVWPPREHAERFDGVIKNYSDAAADTGALLCAVGLAWKECVDATARCPYYAEDGFHPSLKGSQVAAEILFQSLFHKEVPKR